MSIILQIDYVWETFCTLCYAMQFRHAYKCILNAHKKGTATHFPMIRNGIRSICWSKSAHTVSSKPTYCIATKNCILKACKHVLERRICAHAWSHTQTQMHTQIFPPIKGTNDTNWVLTYLWLLGCLQHQSNSYQVFTILGHLWSSK